MQCYNDGCTQELTGRQRQYCSDRCRKASSRTNKAVEDGSGSTNADKSDIMYADTGHAQALCHYYAHPDQYAQRTAPELLNWGEPMNSVELTAGPFRHNRVTIPGDWDYEGAFA